MTLKHLNIWINKWKSGTHYSQSRIFTELKTKQTQVVSLTSDPDRFMFPKIDMLFILTSYIHNKNSWIHVIFVCTVFLYCLLVHQQSSGV